MMISHFFGESIFYATEGRRHNPNIEMPTEDEPFPVPPDQEHGPPVDEAPGRPGKSEDQPDQPPIREPGPNEPMTLV